jgi:cystathionine beta-lyase/cystathionine gamma-synthase
VSVRDQVRPSAELFMKPDDICSRPPLAAPGPAPPLVEPIHLATVYRCADPGQAAALLDGELPGYVYRRDGHPNADVLAQQLRALHGADRAAICGSGMAALAAVVLAQLRSGDHVVISNQLYGRSQYLLTVEAARLGIQATQVDTCNLDAVAAAIKPQTRMLLAETIANPTLRVSDVAALARIAHDHGALLVIDNTFASPLVCCPLAHGADLVFESLTKIINGHGDVLLGMVCGTQRHWERMAHVLTTWGLGPSPFDCWLATRGLGTLALRVERASTNALSVAAHLARHKRIVDVSYPGLASHPDHALARRQFAERFGTIVSFTLDGGLDAATRFIHSASKIPFSPSLGELSTTLSHPQSTSHRALSDARRRALGIGDGMIRLSVGIESPEFLIDALDEALAAV